MTVIVTMAGLGARFSREGYSVPKYKVAAYGRTLFEWSMLSLREFFSQEFLFATLEGEDERWLLQCARQMGIRRCRVISRSSLSAGQAQTAYEVVPHALPSAPLWIYNIDTYIERGMRPQDMEGFSGCIYVFESFDPSMSFVRFSAEDQVVELAEKRAISSWATVGMYGFESAEKFSAVYEDAYERGAVELINGERYVAPMYELMLRSGLTLTAPKLCADTVHILGTPAQVQQFDQSARPPLGNIG